MTKIARAHPFRGIHFVPCPKKNLGPGGVNGNRGFTDFPKKKKDRKK